MHILLQMLITHNYSSIMFNAECVCLVYECAVFLRYVHITIMYHAYLFVHVGDGKTHYIKKHLSTFPHYLIIAINESFTPLNAILRLRSLPSDTSCGVFFNFTIPPSTVSNIATY